MFFSALVLVAVQTPLIVNGNFSRGTDGWTLPDASVAQSRVIDSGNPQVGRALRFDVKAVPGGTVWAAQLGQPIRSRLVRGTPLRLSLWMRSPEALQVGVMVQEGQSPFTSSFSEVVKLSPAWREVALSGTAHRDLAPGEAMVNLHLAHGTGTIEVGQIRLEQGSASTASLERPVELLRNGDFRGPLDGNWAFAVDAPQTSQVIDATIEGRSERALRLVFAPGPDAQPWSINVGNPAVAPIASADVVYVTFWARSRTRSMVGVMYELAETPHTKILSQTVRLTPEWKSYRFASPSSRAFASGQSRLTLFLAYDKGEVELARVSAKNVGRTPMSKLDVTMDFYGGQENPGTWRAAALKRIEQIRKGDLTVNVVNSAGQPVNGAQVSIKMTRHAFRFGTAGPAFRVVGDDPDSVRWRESLLRVFNTFTFENDHKWTSYEGHKRNGTVDEVDRALEWLLARGFQVRGHNVVWGSQSHLPAGFLDLPNEQAIAQLEARAREIVGKYKGKLYLWDVVNEAVTERALWEKLGWNQFDRLFHLTKQLDPKVLTCYNDFNATEESQAGPQHRRRFIEIMKRSLAAGTPIDVIGLQAHVGTPITPIARVNEILDEMGALGPRLEITEYDLGVFDDKTHSEHMRDFLTVCFAHPKVDGFILWGFWEGAHWRANEFGHLIHRDWRERPAWRELERLVRREWWTDVILRTNGRGMAAARGFLGTYEVTVTVNGRTERTQVNLERGKPARVVVRI